MTANPKSFLFVTSNVSRGLATLATSLQKSGFSAAIASPVSNGIVRRLRVPHVEIYKIKIFGREFLIPSRKFREFLKSGPHAIHAIDMPAAKLAARMKLKASSKPIDFGLDLALFSPNSIAVLRITRFLSEYNIAPHQKMIVVISQMGASLNALLDAMKRIDDPDLVIAIYGFSGVRHARKIMSQTKASGQEFRTIYIKNDADLPTVMRSTYAVMSIGPADRDLLMAAVAQGRPTIWPDNEFGIRANIRPPVNPTADDIRHALVRVLAMSGSERAAIEKKNLDAAKKFSIEHTVKQMTF
ncbi:MAG: hypothetical protein LBK26_04170 [Rickettsiales bacterium]|nr:hypothetical protein [Rickettsiales bacterium]